MKETSDTEFLSDISCCNLGMEIWFFEKKHQAE